MTDQETTHVDKGLEDFENRLEATQAEESAFIVTEMTDFGVLESPAGSERKSQHRRSDHIEDEDYKDMETFIN